MSSDKPTKKSSRTPLIVIGSIVLFIIIGILIPTLMPSGANDYTGVKQKAANVALATDSAVGEEIYNRWTSQHIVKMELTPPNTMNGGVTCSTDPNLYYSYVVTIQRVTFLGIPVHEVAISNCLAG